jgi:hypothetical protein
MMDEGVIICQSLIAESAVWLIDSVLHQPPNLGVRAAT